MTIEELRTMPLNKLVELLYILEDQKQINIIAYELTCRMYMPFGDVTFEELLLKNGYVPISKKKETTSHK